MQVVSIGRTAVFGVWKNKDNAEDLFGELILTKDVNKIRKLNKDYSEFESDDCSLLLGKMYNSLRNSSDVYDYSKRKNVITKKDKNGRFNPINGINNNLIKSLYKEFCRIECKTK